MLIWQACEVFYFFAVWMHIADFFVAPGFEDWVYALAVILRVAGELFIAVLVIRDIWSPWHDPVRADGLSDDPLGGILDEGIDSEAWSGDEYAVEGGRGVSDLDVEFVPDGRRGHVGGDEDHAHLHVGRFDEPALPAGDDER
jgi:hypothetical protein